MDTLAAKKALIQEATEREALLFLSHDGRVAAGRLREHNGRHTL
jgi:hypothetical protein